MIGYAFCGSFCTISHSLAVLKQFRESGYDIQPIFSASVGGTDTRFGKACDLRSEVEALCGRGAIDTVLGAEPLGPRSPLEALIVAPCTGNTLSKIAHGITDGAVTMAVKAHLRCDRPLLLALATNDALSSNLANLGALLMRKGVYFVPMVQDDPLGKPHSLVANFSRLPEAFRAMVEGRQLYPIFC